MRVLMLGGTTEASALARALVDHPDIDSMMSLAGRTQSPARPPIPYRIGGFGGVPGLVQYLAEHQIDAVVDATHPFAEQISRNAAAACGEAGVPLLVLTRPAWTPVEGDRWTQVDQPADAAAALGEEPLTVFLTVGRLTLPAFATAPQHLYVIRTIDPPEGAEEFLPNHRIILERGPFALGDEMALMKSESVDVVVTKNSGGQATSAKLAAARQLGLPVILIERPKKTEGEEAHDVDAALAWISAHRPAP